jgi:hypothetical protein
MIAVVSIVWAKSVRIEDEASRRGMKLASGFKIGRLSLGPTHGCAIKIDPDENVELGLMISEGLETGLAGQMLGHRPCWATGSASGIRTFPLLGGVECLTQLVDHDAPDQPGRQAGQEAATG